MPGPVRLHYDEPMLRAAVRAFMWRLVLRRRGLWLASLGLLLICVVTGWFTGPSFATGLAAASILFVASIIAVLWRAHFTNTIGRFRALDPPSADAVFTEDALTVSSNLGASTIPWARFTGMWELDRCWMLFLAPNQFMTLPAAALSEELRAFLRAKLPSH